MNERTPRTLQIDDDSPESQIVITPRAQAALDELRSLIAASFPEATFDIYKGYEPAGIYLSATVDVEDMQDVVDVFIERLVDMQVDDGIPVYVSPRRPFERTWAMFQEQQRRRAQAEPLSADWFDSAARSSFSASTRSRISSSVVSAGSSSQP